MKIGIYGGTFDPIHIGHLIVAEYAREALALEEIHFVVAVQPPHKALSAISPVEHRFRMVELALRGNPHFVASDVEIRRGGISFTVDTLAWFQRELGLARQDLYFLMGLDSLAELSSWRQPERILELATVVALRRPDVDVSSIPAQYLEKVIPLQTPLIEVSATDIRQRVRSGRSIRYLVPEAVSEYICEHGLYR